VRQLRSPRRLIAGFIAGFIALAPVASAQPAGAAAGFGDVKDNWFYTAPIEWMVQTGITNGTAPGCFSPEQPATRGEMAVFLHRFVGSPALGTEWFDDVKPTDFYADAVGWMATTGITTGTSATTFSPDRLVTRGELATFLHRLAGEPLGAREPFTDVQPGEFFAAAAAWMATTGITTGTTPTTFSPYRLISRGELATFLYRYAGEPSVTVSAGGVCSTDPAANLIEAETLSLNLLNDLRIGRGVAPLSRTTQMDAYARNWSMTMHDQSIFNHSGGPYGENIAWSSVGAATPAEAAALMHDLWINSPRHLLNMTMGHYTEAGIGFWQGPGGWYATHVFR